MTDEPRATRRVAKPQPDETKGNFENVEFLDTSLADPLNVLRLKLKDLSSLPAGIQVRRVMIVCDVISEETGRGIDLTWSEGADESIYAVQDSIISLLTRVQQIIATTYETSED
jgi:hypothetical protein